MIDVLECSLVDLQRAVFDGDITVQKIASSFIEVIKERESDVEAWHFFDPELALSQAKALDNNGGPKGRLYGIPVGVKDLIDTADMPTEYGTVLYMGHRPDQDASCVGAYKAEGAITMGKTVSTELALPGPGKTRNPHNRDHTPGGSSSGSAAAVAAGMVPVALGTQSGGSLIRPCSFCGVVGYKPSFDTFDLDGVKLLSRTLDHLGIVTRNVRDAAYFTGSISDNTEMMHVEARRPRVGVFRCFDWDRADRSCQAVLDDTINTLVRHGVEVSEVSLPPGTANPRVLHWPIAAWEIHHELLHELEIGREKLSPQTLALADAGIAVDEYEDSMKQARALRLILSDAFGSSDIWLTAAAPGEAPKGLGATGDPVFNNGWSLMHFPCMTIPAGHGASGLPIGVQLVGRQNDDIRLLSSAAFVEDCLREGL